MEEIQQEMIEQKKDRWTDGIWIPILILAGIILFGALYIYEYVGQRKVDGYATVDGDKFIITDTVECTNPNGRIIETKSEPSSSGIHFVSKVNGPSCIYTFTLYNEEITVNPEIHFYRISSNMAEQWKIHFDLHESDGIWNATVSGVRNNHEVSTVECIDVEKNGIILDFWGESATLQIYQTP